jgi:DUF1365 family protein
MTSKQASVKAELRKPREPSIDQTKTDPSESDLNSCLYEGFVHHRRRSPVAHAFHYRLFMAWIDLEEVDRIFSAPRLWSTKRFSVVRFRRSDYLGDPQRDLAECVRELVRQRIGRKIIGPIRLLTMPRNFGISFNPLSVYYCYRADGRRVDAVVAEVTNTPWGQRHCYVIPWDSHEQVQRFVCAKQFHVSPFMPMKMSYAWRLTTPSRKVSLRLENHDATGRVFDATLVLRRRKLFPARAICTSLRFPMMTGRILASIYWQAFQLWWKNVPFFPHPEKVAARESIPPPSKN